MGWEVEGWVVAMEEVAAAETAEVAMEEAMGMATGKS